MLQYDSLNPKRVFYYFKEISAIPRGSGNRTAISNYCVSFAKEHGLAYIQDKAENVIIYKPASKGYDSSAPVILQGHLDMVCQKTEEATVDFETDGIHLILDGDRLKAEHTTLGADNGIAVAMMLAILEDDALSHPPIEAIFTTDEEIGMLGAKELPYDKINGKTMINMDAEEPDTVTVSCAGGSDFEMKVPYRRVSCAGTRVVIVIKGLKGGHSGIEINQGRVNADILAGRILAKGMMAGGNLISLWGGDKANAIPLLAELEFAVEDAKTFETKMSDVLREIQYEILDREENFAPEILVMEQGEFSVLDEDSQKRVMTALLAVPNGVMEMSRTIENLVETSLNLGIMKTEDGAVVLRFALRSNKKSAMQFLEDRLSAIADYIGAQTETGGYYPPWELNPDSPLQRIYHQVHKEQLGTDAKTVAIHAGLECAVFVANIPGLDCIAIGPDLTDVHTVQESLSVSSVAETYNLVLKILEKSR